MGKTDDNTSDTRNVMDEFKGLAHEDIVKQLDGRGVELEIAIENTLRDFNMGTIVRTANAVGVRTIHVIGRRQWNKRGAMMSDKYLSVEYYPSPKDFKDAMVSKSKQIYACENNVTSLPLYDTELPTELVWVFGQEGTGLSDEILKVCDAVISIPQLGSTRSMNVGVAAGVAMYEWYRQHKVKTR